MRNIHTSICSFIICTIVMGCAQVRSVSGGEKDITPPKIVSAKPENLSLQFKGNSFTLDFDEYVQLRDLQKELLVSPPLKSTPRIKLKQRSVEVSWDDTLRAETTYIFQFGKAIADVNESNVINDVSYVFSTGSRLDSLTCGGLVIDAFTDKPVNASKVLLFDSIQHVFNSGARPAYFARTNERGEFQFNFVRSGSYALCSLSDENGNNHFDLGESIDWKENVSPTLEEDTMKQILYTSIPRDTVVRGFNYVTDSSAVLKFEVKPWQPSTRVNALSGDTVVQWLRSDTLYATIKAMCGKQAEVSVVCGERIIDTLSIEHIEDDNDYMKLFALFNQKMTATDSLLVRTRRPIRRTDDSFLHCFEDSVEIACGSMTAGIVQRQITIDKKPGRSYTVEALPGWITDDCGEINDTMDVRFSVYTAKEIGSLRFKIPEQLLGDPLTFRLMDKSKRVVSEMTRIQSSEWTLDGLVPGEYTAVICGDSNANGYFDPLQLSPFVSTERNYVYGGSIQVRANWEVVIDWTGLTR